MKIPVFLFALLDIAPDEPFTYGSTGQTLAVASGLILTAIAIAVFLLFRNRLSTAVRGAMAAILLLSGIIAAVLISWAFARYDAEAIRNKPVYHRVENPYAHQDSEDPKPEVSEDSNAVQKKQSQSNSKK